jgi:outer membrane receptor for ferrienterochelin and colicins
MTESFFDAGIKITYDVKLTDAIKMQLSSGVKNNFNSYQSDFDSGIDRDPADVYGLLSPRTICFGLKIGNL